MKPVSSSTAGSTLETVQEVVNANLKPPEKKAFRAVKPKSITPAYRSPVRDENYSSTLDHKASRNYLTAQKKKVNSGLDLNQSVQLASPIIQQRKLKALAGSNFRSVS